MKYKWHKIIVIIASLSIAAFAISGCQNKSPEDDQIMTTLPASSGESKTDDSVTQGLAEGEKSPTENTDENVLTLDDMVSYLGETKDMMTALLDENPESVDEGGYAYQRKSIRVWLDSSNETVSQVFTQRKDVEFLGAFIGDPVENFEKALGQPLSQSNSDWHFAYGDAFISVVFDEASRETIAVYVLSEDF